MGNNEKKDETVRIDSESYKTIKEKSVKDDRSIKKTIKRIVDFYKSNKEKK